MHGIAVDPIITNRTFSVLAHPRRLSRCLACDACASHTADMRDDYDQLRDSGGSRPRRRLESTSYRTSLLGAYAVALDAVITFVWFLVTERMLDMFKKKEPKEKRRAH